MEKRKSAGSSYSGDPDDAPELTEDLLRRSDLYEGKKLIRRGRPPLPAPKGAVSLRLDADVLEHFRKGGAGWQSRINAALRKAARLPARKGKT
jgi:uncharacterized protein (DUF4415 family)